MLVGTPGALLLGAMGLLFVAAIVSGVALYWPLMRRLDFASVRTTRSRRLIWLDLHNLVGVIAIAWALRRRTDRYSQYRDRHPARSMAKPRSCRGAPACSGTSALPPHGFPSIARYGPPRAVAPGPAPMAILFPSASRSTDERHYGIFMRGRSQATQRLFRPVYIDAGTGAVDAVVPLP